MKISNVVFLTAAVAIAGSVAMIVPAFAQTSVTAQVGHGAWVGAGGYGGGMHPGIFGTVSSVSGNTLTVTVAARPMRPMPEQAQVVTPAPSSTPVVYTVDATNAKIYKGSVTSTVSVSSIAQGDTVMVQGTITGTNVAATVIRDGVTMMGGRPNMPGMGFGQRGGASSTAPRPTSTPIIQGNGEPVIGGNVTAISGTTLTVTNASNVTYTIDAASSTVVVKGVSSTFSNVAVGDSVIVQGAVSGNAVTASSIIDQGVKTTNASSTAPHMGGGIGAGIGGFFGSIGGFFKHLFGF